MDSDLLSFLGVGFAYPNGDRLSGRYPALRPQALQDLTFSVGAGASVALLGCNGSGKSTLLQLGNGLLRPDTGTIRWRGSPLDRSRAGLVRLRAEVGLLFQDPDDQLFGGTIGEDVAFAPRNQGLGERQVRERVAESLEMVGLPDFADLPPHVLSHGMRKRVALAGVLAARPSLLLLDEPTAGMDPPNEERLMSVLTEYVAKGAAVLLATHDLDLARRFADLALVLAEGRLVAFGAVDEVLDDRDALLAAGLLRRDSWRRPPPGRVPGGSTRQASLAAAPGETT